MRAIGFFYCTLWVALCINGYTIEHVAMIAIGLAMIAGSYYFERR